ncbi:MAG TPA: DNA adenine methylase [Gemmatales bacterium]|nr:DNA adenine methylase [Gemmatales bacterium]
MSVNTSQHPAQCRENPDYLSRQLITYLGNKRALLGNIGQAVEQVKARLGKNALRVFDAFSGSGVVSRYLKAHAEHLVSNDLEDYAAVTARCYQRNWSTVDQASLLQLVDDLNSQVDSSQAPAGFIEELYSPRDDNHITKEDRVFYTRSNARRLDRYRQLIEHVPFEFKDLLMGPLLSKASIHANTAGVFKGFYKDRRTQIGQFGGSGSDALCRIKGQIVLEPPILSRFECDVEVLQQDANQAARHLKNLDLVYLDPPYNQHPYGSNYFMLNLLVNYQRPKEVSRVSGIPTDWRRSGYNVRSQSLKLLQELIETLDTKFLLISFNDEGFISPQEMWAMLNPLGSVNVLETKYNAFRGSRNFDCRAIHVVEQLFVVERGSSRRTASTKTSRALACTGLE